MSSADKRRETMATTRGSYQHFCPAARALERREIRPARPVSWVLRFTPDRSYTLRFDGERWSRQRGEAEADLVIQTSPVGWVRFLSADRAGRVRWLERSRVAGTSKSVKEF